MNRDIQAIETFLRQPAPIPLECPIQHYDWGDRDWLPKLLGRPNPEHRPFAELWAGAHPDLPATAWLRGTPIPFDALIAAGPDTLLGPSVARRFENRLPFLLKVLAAARPLSLQAHPDADQARAGFAREEREGIPSRSPQRRYRDPWHKPELLVALTEFFALCGFRPVQDILDALDENPELRSFAGVLRERNGDLRALYAWMLALGPARIHASLAPWLRRLRRERDRRPDAPRDRTHWILEASRQYAGPDHTDPGLFSMLLLNLIRLRPGQGLFVPAGTLHSYLGGMGVEVMANSNNVLRAGLTTKFVDSRELFRILHFQSQPPQRISAPGTETELGCQTYPTPAREFFLSRHGLAAGQVEYRRADSPTLLLVTRGRIAIRWDGADTCLRSPGQALFAPPETSWHLRAETDALYWRVRVPNGS